MITLFWAAVLYLAGALTVVALLIFALWLDNEEED